MPTEIEPQKINILLVDDDEEDFLLIRDYLSDLDGPAKYLLEWVQTYQAGMEQILIGKYDVYLVDHFLGTDSGLDLLQEAILSGCMDPIIIVTGKSDQEIDQAALLAGATDYLVKNQMNGQSLERSIRYALERNRLIKKIRDMALRDALTGLYNLRELQRFLEYEMIKSRRYNHPFSLLMIDLDHFKEINDRYGHRAGDDVLQQVGQSLLHNIRGCDLAARYGGDEFTLVLPETPARQACMGADRLRRTIEAQPIRVTDTHGVVGNLNVTISVGVAEYPYDANSAEMLIELADHALYKAKHQGCNQVVRYLGIPET